MNTLKQIVKPKNCRTHNQTIIMLDSNPKKGGYCLVCIQEKTGMIPAEIYLQKLNVFINQSEEQFNKNIQLLQNWHNSLVNYKSVLIQSLDKILKVILEQIETFNIYRQKLMNLSQSDNDQDQYLDDLQSEDQQYQLKYEEAKNQVRKQLQDFQKKYFDNLEDLLSTLNQQNKINMQDPFQKFQYELIQESCKKETKSCWAFAFNKDSSLLAVGCEKEIIIREINVGLFGEELKTLTNHTDNVYCLQFMNKSNSFISGSKDKMIIIWELDSQKNQWFAKYTLEEHKDWINCILLNKNDDLLISGSADQTIKFWNLLNNNWTCRQTIVTDFYVYAISLNEQENKLISLGYGMSIISVMKLRSDDQWSIVQTINVSNFGSRLCFTIGDQFIFIPSKSNQLEIYNYDQGKQEFALLKLIQIESQESNNKFFPCQYIKQLKILQIRYGQKIYIFKVNKDSDYQLIQSIGFQHYKLFGRLSDDGLYLATWDEGSQQVQVRGLKYQQQ